MKTESKVNSFLPLSETTFFILLCLSPGPNHGYGIMKSVHEMSGGRITFSTGTLYGALKRLLDQNWIVRIGEGEEKGDESNRSRKEYELTSFGRSILSAEVSRMKTLVQLSITVHPEEA